MNNEPILKRNIKEVLESDDAYEGYCLIAKTLQDLFKEKYDRNLAFNVNLIDDDVIFTFNSSDFLFPMKEFETRPYKMADRLKERIKKQFGIVLKPKLEVELKELTDYMKTGVLKENKDE
jgi:hypothetical protein